MTTFRTVIPLPRRAAGAQHFVELPQPFAIYRGGELKGARIAWESWGELNATRDNGVLLFTGLSPSAHACSSLEDPTSGWWEYMIGPGHPVDTRKYFVVCVNSLGSCFGSTGPASLNPASGQAYGTDFPKLSVEDIACAGHEVVRALGIEKLHSVAGASLGGMAALCYSILFPAETQRLVSISGATQAAPFAIGIRSLQREIIRSDPGWRGGAYSAKAGPTTGMRLARKLGLLSYRGMDEWQERFGHGRIPDADRNAGDFGIEFEIESYLDYNARKFIGNFDANCYLYLSRAMDLFDASEHGGSLQAAIARMRTEDNLIIGVESDFLFPLRQQRQLVELLEGAGRRVRFAALPATHGHDSFLVDEAHFAPVMAEFFA